MEADQKSQICCFNNFSPPQMLPELDKSPHAFPFIIAKRKDQAQMQLSHLRL